MCCFSRPVRSVSATNIFAREAADGHQYLAYGMTLSAEEDLAMILPLPVPQSTPEDAVTFIDLSSYPELFRDLEKGFPDPVPLSRSRAAPRPQPRAPLAVVEVGSFEASFVPTVHDFERLDSRFRLPGSVWSKLPGHERFGFAVFKLKQGNKRIHPMAFTFPRADDRSLFFPTVHIHDGEVHPDASFDHALYCQRGSRARGEIPATWRASRNASSFVDVERARGMVDGDRPVHRRQLEGRAANRNVVLKD